MTFGVPLTWWAQWELFTVILARVVGLFAVAPMFGGAGVPVLVRIGLAGFVAALLTGPVATLTGAPPPFPWLAGPWGYLALGAELLIGGALGFVALLFFTAVQTAGQLMDIPLGFGMVNVLDPQTGGYVPVLGQFQSVLAVLIFFTVNGHHGVLRALAASYEVLPPGGTLTGDWWMAALTGVVSQVFLLGVRLALPLVVAAFLTDVALAIVARAVPQINVFLTGFPLKVMVGMLILAVVLPTYVALLAFTFGDAGAMMRVLWTLLGGG